MKNRESRPLIFYDLGKNISRIKMGTKKKENFMKEINDVDEWNTLCQLQVGYFIKEINDVDEWNTLCQLQVGYFIKEINDVDEWTTLCQLQVGYFIKEINDVDEWNTLCQLQVGYFPVISQRATFEVTIIQVAISQM